MEKTCIPCTNWYLDPKRPDWSDETPGAEASTGCIKGKWGMVLDEDFALQKYRENICKARTCEVFEPFAGYEDMGR